MQPHRPATRRKMRMLIIIILGVPLILATAFSLYWWRYSPLNRDWVVETLEKRYQCEVELKSFDVSFFPEVSISGEGLVLKRQQPSGPTPLASLRKFSASAGWLGLARHPRHFGKVRLEGMVLVIPPRSKQAEKRKQTQQQQQASKATIVLDEILANNALLKIVSANPQKPPHEFEIQKLQMHSVGLGQPLSF